MDTQTSTSPAGTGEVPADAGTGPARPAPTTDPGTRQAALWATLVAVPLTLIIAFLAVNSLRPEAPEPAPVTAPGTASARPQSTEAVALPAPALPERPATVCRALLSRLPGTVGELAQRPVTAGPEQNAAYGDPAITLACGVPAVTVAPDDDVWVVNRVCWRVAQGPTAVELTTLDREVPVRVTVPRAYEQALQWVAPLADPVLATVGTVPDAPSDCQS